MPFHQTYIAGVKFRPGADEVLSKLDPGAELSLQPEPTNPYDPNAVKVMSGTRHIGYVPKDLSADVAAKISAGHVTGCRLKLGKVIDIEFIGDAA